MFFCEDHFDLPNDMENYMEYHLMGSVSQVRMKLGCFPTRFKCQPDSIKRTSHPAQRPYVLKKQRKQLIEEIEKDLAQKSSSRNDAGPNVPSSENSEYVLGLAKMGDSCVKKLEKPYLSKFEECVFETKIDHQNEEFKYFSTMDVFVKSEDVKINIKEEAGDIVVNTGIDNIKEEFDEDVANEELHIKEEVDVFEEQALMPISNTMEMEPNTSYSTVPAHQFTSITEDKTENKIFRCAHCNYEAKMKRSLQNHVLTHMNRANLRMFSCRICNFKTIHKHSLGFHMLLHTDPSKVETFNCAKCNFQTIHKNNLRTHMLVHQDTSKIKMFTCTTCNFQSKYKKSCATHMLKHYKSEMDETYACTECPYQTKYKSNIRRHLIVHRNSNSVKMFACAKCNFETKYNCNLRVHMFKVH